MTVLRTSGSLGRSTVGSALDGGVHERCSGGTTGVRRLKRRILPKHRLLELAKRQAGLDPELLDEQASGLLVGLQRLSLAPRPVEGAHQLASQLLAERILGDEGLELPDEIRVAAEPELELDPLADHGEPEILEPRDLRPSEVLERKFLQRRPSPEPECFTQQFDRALRVVLRTRLGDERLEAVAIELPRFESEQITGRPRQDQAWLVLGWPGWSSRRRCDTYVWITLAADSGRCSPQMSSISRLTRDDLVRAQEQAQEERALFGGSQMLRRRLSRQESRGGRGRETPCARLRVRLCFRTTLAPGPSGLQRRSSVPSACLERSLRQRTARLALHRNREGGTE